MGGKPQGTEKGHTQYFWICQDNDQWWQMLYCNNNNKQTQGLSIVSNIYRVVYNVSNNDWQDFNSSMTALSHKFSYCSHLCFCVEWLMNRIDNGQPNSAKGNKTMCCTAATTATTQGHLSTMQHCKDNWVQPPLPPTNQHNRHLTVVAADHELGTDDSAGSAAQSSINLLTRRLSLGK